MMMFIDYITLMLINMVCGFAIIAVLLLTDINKPDRHHWAPAFGIVGLVAAVCGFAMTFTWPLPNPYNIAFGEMSICLGVLFLGAAYSFAKNLNLLPLGIFSFFTGTSAILIGIRIMNLGLTKNPNISGVGFVLSGAGGVFAFLVLLMPNCKFLRIAGAILMSAAAVIWAWTGYLAYWMHLVPPE